MKLTKEEKIAKLKAKAKPVKADSKWKEIARWNEEHADALEDYMIIAFRIQKALKSKKITQKEFASQLGVSPQALTRIMKGRQNLTLNKVRQIERVLEVSLMNIPKVEQRTTQLRTQMVPVEVHYNNSTPLVATKLNDVAKSTRHKTKNSVGTVSIAS